MEGYKHKTPIQLRFKDIDLLGHVNNANHFTYIELARVHYFNHVAGEEINWSKHGIILAKATIDYKLPVLINDKVFVYTKCSRIGNKSFDLSYKIVKENPHPNLPQKGEGETVLAEAMTVLVCFDYQKSASIPIPDEWKKKLQHYDNL